MAQYDVTSDAATVVESLTRQVTVQNLGPQKVAVSQSPGVEVGVDGVELAVDDVRAFRVSTTVYLRAEPDGVEVGNADVRIERL